MITKSKVLSEVEKLTARMGTAPTTGDLAASMNAAHRSVARVVKELREAGELLQVGRADRPGLVVAEHVPHQVRRLRQLAARIEARFERELAAELEELRALERELADPELRVVPT